MEPYFFFSPLDRYETSLLTLSATIPRIVVNLWIVIRIVAMAQFVGKRVEHVKDSFLGICKKRRNGYRDHYYW